MTGNIGGRMVVLSIVIIFLEKKSSDIVGWRKSKDYRIDDIFMNIWL